MEISGKTVLWIVMGILLISVFYLTYQKSTLTGNAVAGKLDTTGWTENEKMNYEMHGTIPACVSSSASASNGMVGGC
jgi:hypothetical protein